MVYMTVNFSTYTSWMGNDLPFQLLR